MRVAGCEIGNCREANEHGEFHNPNSTIRNAIPSHPDQEGNELKDAARHCPPLLLDMSEYSPGGAVFQKT